MSVILVDKKINPLSIKVRVTADLKDEPVLFLWEDPISSNLRFVDKIILTKDVEYYSGLNKNINFFENGIVFKIILLKNYREIFSYEFKNLSFIEGKNVLYISQNSYTGYSYSARNYVYQLIDAGYNVSWDTRFSVNKIYKSCNKHEDIVFNCLNKKIEKIDSIIIHHTPESWFDIYKRYKLLFENVKIYGLTTWETTHIHNDWVNLINNNIDEVIVHSKFNVNCFKNSGVNKKINLWYNNIFPFQKVDVDIDNLFKKFNLYNNGSFVSDLKLIKSIIDSKTVYYNISQFINRKNVNQVINAFCKKFSKNDNVCLFLKIYLEKFDENDKNFLKYKIHNIVKNYENCPEIICCLDYLNDNEISIIHEFGDVYFTLNRGEGFGLSTYTAKKIGNKVICGKFGAEKEFLDDNDILLDYELRSSRYLDDFNKYYIDDVQQCAYYDTDYVVSKLQYFPKVNKQLYNYTK
jgi:hypothetical protein